MNAYTWNQIVATLPSPHLLQTWEWGEFKSHYGWKPSHLTWPDSTAGSLVKAAALLLERSVKGGGIYLPFKVMYLPKGPLLDWSDAALRTKTLDELQAFARQSGATFIKIDPDVLLGTGVPGTPEAAESSIGSEVVADLQNRGWIFSPDQIQFRNSVWLDLTPDEAELVAGMKQKTRYNINLARRKGVQVRTGTGADLENLYRLYAETSLRDGFAIRDFGYYKQLWTTYMDQPSTADENERSDHPHATPLLAEVDGNLAAGLVLFTFADRAWYLHGMSSSTHREKMPNHLLQWEAIRLAKARGCRIYDLWGAPDQFTPDDPFW